MAESVSSDHVSVDVQYLFEHLLILDCFYFPHLDQDWNDTGGSMCKLSDQYNVKQIKTAIT